MPDLYRLDIMVNEEDFPLAQAIVAESAEMGWEEESLPTGDMLLRVTCEAEAEREALAAELAAALPAAELSREFIPDQDWLANWRSYFTPVEAGEFLILPPWMKEEDPRGRTAVVIEPKSAFGTGHHPTTTMCLDAITRLHKAGVLKPGQTFLDMGTGTGILGIGCVKLGLSGFGADIDPLSISNSIENCEMNGVGAEFEIQEGSVELVEGRQFDVVIANILAGPLKEMAPALLPLVRPGDASSFPASLRCRSPACWKPTLPWANPSRYARPPLPTTPPVPPRRNSPKPTTGYASSGRSSISTLI